MTARIPYESRGDAKAYRFEMTDHEHEKLAKVLHKVRGKVALSSYHCELMDGLYVGWRRVEAPTKICHSIKKPRKEVLWVNYAPEEETRSQGPIGVFKPSEVVLA